MGKAWGSLGVTGMQRPWCDSKRCMGLEETGRPLKVGRVEVGGAGGCRVEVVGCPAENPLI